MGRRFPWSEEFDRIFRNEGVTGSNPVSSTECPDQGDFGPLETSLVVHDPRRAAPQGRHRDPALEHLSAYEVLRRTGS